LNDLYNLFPNDWREDISTEKIHGNGKKERMKEIKNI